MTEKLTTATAIRAGSKIIYVTEPGEIIALVPNQMRAVIAHPERQPKFLNFDGTTEPLVFTEQDYPKNPLTTDADQSPSRPA